MPTVDPVLIEKSTGKKIDVGSSTASVTATNTSIGNTPQNLINTPPYDQYYYLYGQSSVVEYGSLEIPNGVTVYVAPNTTIKCSSSFTIRSGGSLVVIPADTDYILNKYSQVISEKTSYSSSTYGQKQVSGGVSYRYPNGTLLGNWTPTTLLWWIGASGGSHAQAAINPAQFLTAAGQQLWGTNADVQTQQGFFNPTMSAHMPLATKPILWQENGTYYSHLEQHGTNINIAKTELFGARGGFYAGADTLLNSYMTPYISMGGAGGGCVKIISPSVTVESGGTISANGQDAYWLHTNAASNGTGTWGGTKSSSTPSNPPLEWQGNFSNAEVNPFNATGAGGGSGGSIWIVCGTVSGTGTLTCSGGQPTSLLGNVISTAGGKGEIRIDSVNYNANFTYSCYSYDTTLYSTFSPSTLYESGTPLRNNVPFLFQSVANSYELLGVKNPIWYY